MPVGIGFDIHTLVAGRPFYLGGVRLNHPFGPLGHSDGDAVLHAVIDALLGATGQGDIGQKFPDSDPDNFGAESLKLLQRTWAEIGGKWRIVNVDVNVMLERPKLGPIKPKMAQAIAGALGIDAKLVNVKAKTLEGLGPIGEGKAVAAQAVVEVQPK